ncbi:hypothetical protein BS17DRAFT_800897 [Gyrodon lividus]|nr:hypothetical protein BS17DRAFT_800897 [Gyrodon lividus]
MPRESLRQQRISGFQTVQFQIGILWYSEILEQVLLESLISFDSNSSGSDDSNSSSSFSSTSTSSSDQSPNNFMFCSREVVAFENAIGALLDEVEKTRVLSSRMKAVHAPQLHLLDEWKLDNPHHFHRKLHVSPDVFSALIDKISDMAEWAGVSVGTVHNCYKRVMIAILHHHDAAIHFDPTRADDQQEREDAKAWVESCTCVEWRDGFLCVNGTPFNLFQKPGWHGEGFFDRQSHYSLSNQIVIFPHNLKIVDYAIGIPGSLHDSSAFQQTHVAQHPAQFFSYREWLWVDSAYLSQKWCECKWSTATDPYRAAFSLFGSYVLKFRQQMIYCI